MSQCAVKRGIITLRDCGNTASDTCASCGRAMCQEHTRSRSGELICVECYAKEAEDLKKAQRAKGVAHKSTKNPSHTVEENDWEDTSWPYYYRHHYYTSYGYHPFYYGSYYDTYYDDYDMRSFDQGARDTLDDDEAAAGGFYDS